MAPLFNVKISGGPSGSRSYLLFDPRPSFLRPPFVEAVKSEARFADGRPISLDGSLTTLEIVVDAL